MNEKIDHIGLGIHRVSVKRKHISLKAFNKMLFIALIFLKVLSYVFKDAGIGSLEREHYGVLILFILSCIAEWGKEKNLKIGKQFILFDELKAVLLMILVYAIFTCYYIVKNSGTLNSVTISGFIHLLFPIIMVYLMVNLYSNNEIYKLVEWSFIITFVFYIGYWVIYLGPQSNRYWTGGVSWGASYSPYESTFFSYWAIAFFLYFNHFKINKLYQILSFIFVIFTFKRFLVLVAIIGLIFDKYINSSKKLSKKAGEAILVGMGAVSIIYIALALGYMSELFEKIFHRSFASFTMSRTVFLEYVLNHGFKSQGLYSTKLYLAGQNHWSIEMDLPMIYVELGIIAVVSTVVCLWSLIKNSRYSAFIVIVTFIQLTTSAWFDYPFYWVFMYLTLGSLIKEERGEIIRNTGLNVNWKKGTISWR